MNNLAFLLEQERLERVSPKLEVFRQPARIKGARGGRAAGAKSWSITSLIIQDLHRNNKRAVFLREFQKSLEESAYQLSVQTIERLRYPGWNITRESIDSKSGSHIIFRGMKDYHSVSQAKGLEGFDIFFIEEASAISMQSLEILLPTIVRRPGAELWFCYNPELDPDPITEKIWNRNRDDAVLVDLLPGKEDNPWWNDGLQKEMELDFAYDPDNASHVWLGQPRKQGLYSVFSRTQIIAAMKRQVSDEGAIEIGVDVARFGEDRTVIYKRKGMKIIDSRVYLGQDTQRTAQEAYEMAGRSQKVAIKVDDTGVGGGVTDALRGWGANVIPVNFGATAHNTDMYTSIADELWFNFPADEAQIPDDTELLRELTSRQYNYDTRGRRKIESKADMKKRIGKSPDKADAILLCYFNPTPDGGHFVLKR